MQQFHTTDKMCQSLPTSPEVLVSSCVNELQKLMAFDHIGHVLLVRALTW